MRFLLFFIMLNILGCGAFSKTSKYAEKQQSINLIENSTVALLRVHKKPYEPFCTGVWVTKNHILTAKHCVGNLYEYYDSKGKFYTEFEIEEGIFYFQTKSENEAYFPNNDVKHEAFIINHDEDHDLALLATLEDINHSVVKIAADTPFVGLPVYILGHTNGFPFTFMEGVVSKTRFEKKGTTFRKVLHITSSIWKGNSGGGAFTEEGKLIGIASYINVNVHSMNFFVHKDIIVDFLLESGLENLFF